MLALEMYRAVEVSTEGLAAIEEAVAAFPASYRRLIGPTLAFQADVLGVGEVSGAPRPVGYREQATVYGELLVTKQTVVGITARRSAVSYRETAAGMLEPVTDDSAEAEVVVFALSPQVKCAPLKAVVERLAAKTGLEFSPFRYASRRFGELKEEEDMSTPAAPSGESLAGARALADKPVRTLAIAIKAAGGLLLGDAAKQLPAELRPDAMGLVETLQDVGLLSTEVVVICTKTNAQVARAPTRAELAESGGITCACGRRLAEERIEDALGVNALGQDLIDGSEWMSVLLLDELTRLGIPLDQIVVSQQAGGDEMDCLFDVSGELVFLELKDKEFNLGNAYSFGSKISVLRPRHAVIVTTEYVGNDAKDHFQRAGMTGARRATYEPEDQPRQVVYIEGLEALRGDLEKLLSSIYEADGASLLDEVLPLAAAESRSVLNALAGGDRGSPPPVARRRSARPRRKPTANS